MTSNSSMSAYRRSSSSSKLDSMNRILDSCADSARFAAAAMWVGLKSTPTKDICGFDAARMSVVRPYPQPNSQYLAPALATLALKPAKKAAQLQDGGARGRDKIPPYKGCRRDSLVP